MKRLARCGRSKVDRNMCRNLHGLIRRDRKILPVKVSSVETMWRTSRKKPARHVKYPVLRLSDWARCSLSKGGHIFLGGHDLEDHGVEFGNTLDQFWSRFRDTDPTFPFFTDFPSREAWRTAIPLAVHGDEGRGRLKRPVMVLATQIVIPINQCKTNMQGLLSCNLTT